MQGEDIRELMKEIALLAGHHESGTPISLLAGRGVPPPSTDMPALADRLLAVFEMGDLDDSATHEDKIYSKCIEILKAGADRGELSKALYAIIRVMHGTPGSDGEYNMLWRMYTGEAYQPTGGRRFDVKIVRSEPEWRSPFPCVDSEEHFMEKIESAFKEISSTC